jgi:hypothetical protein
MIAAVAAAKVRIDAEECEWKKDKRKHELQYSLMFVYKIEHGRIAP